MEQQLPRSLGNVVHPIGLDVLGDVAAHEPDLAAVEVGVSIFQVRLAVAQALDLGAGQDDPRLDLLQEVKLVPRAAVAGDDLEGAVVRLALRFALAAALGHRGTPFASVFD